MAAEVVGSLVTADEMARAAGISSKTFRHCLRQRNLRWHRHYDRWTVWRGSNQHRDMQAVLKECVAVASCRAEEEV